ncbi:hypothetical protein [Archaeoglobus sp.]
MDERYWWVDKYGGARSRKHIEEFLKKVHEVNSAYTFPEYIRRLSELKRFWMEIEPELPLLMQEDIVRIIEVNVGKLLHIHRCIELAEIHAAYPRPIRYSVLEGEAMERSTFRNLKENSFKRILVRFLKYLDNAGLIVKTCYRTKKGTHVHAMYFRLYRMATESDGMYERGYKLLEELKKIVWSLRDTGERRALAERG